jgi:FkbM family methyltransferase
MASATKIPGVFKDIAKVLPEWNPSVIFDVGANVGQSALAYASAFPNAKIHSFEPAPASFDALKEATAEYPNITAHFVALGRERGSVRMIANGMKPTNKIIGDDVEDSDLVIEVKSYPGWKYVKRLGVDRISFLKIDTEGQDYNVLAGFFPMLSSIDFIQVEAAMNLYNKTHVQFRVLEDFLRQEGFHLFRIYDQALEFKRGGRPVLRRANPVFINGSLLDLKNIQ